MDKNARPNQEASITWMIALKVEIAVSVLESSTLQLKMR